SAVRLFADGRRTRASIDVVAHGAGFLAIVCHAPRAAWDELQPDFDFVARSVELDAAAIAPRLQGPLEARQPRAPAPSPSAQKPAAEPPRELPRVRVPTDG